MTLFLQLNCSLNARDVAYIYLMTSLIQQTGYLYIRVGEVCDDVVATTELATCIPKQ